MAEEARFRSFKGMTIAQFMSETLMTPTDAYNAGDTRVFAFFKPAPNPAFGCTIHAETVRNKSGLGGDASQWTIVRTRRQGGCSFV